VKRADDAARVKTPAIAEVRALVRADRVERTHPVVLARHEHERHRSDVYRCELAGELALEGHEIPAAAHVASEQLR